MAKFDQEDLLQKVYEIMTNGGALNAKIASIESEKGALSPGLAAIKDFHFQTWSDKILQSSPCIFFGIEDVAAADGGGAVAKTYTIFVEVVHVDDGQTNDTWKRIARYTRALEELFTENFDFNIPASLVSVDSIRPISFKLEMNTNEEIKVGGISLKIRLI